MATKNLGLIQALFVGTTPPTNTSLIWEDINTSPSIYKSWDGISTWIPLNSALPLLRTGSEIAFDRYAEYGTAAAPITATTLTDSNIGATRVIQQIYHNAASFTPPASWQKIGGGDYVPSVLNYIFVKYESDTRKTFWVLQES